MRFLSSRFSTLWCEACVCWPMCDSGWRNLDSRVRIPPYKWNPRQPVFPVDQLTNAGKIFRRQNAGGGGKFGTSDFSPDGARRDLDLRVIADALVLAQFAVRHDIELVAVFSKPDGRIYSDATFSQGREADVTLSMDFGGDWSHADIVKRAEWPVERRAFSPVKQFAVNILRALPFPIAPTERAPGICFAQG